MSCPDGQAVTMILVIGGTGAGKTIFINYACKLKLGSNGTCLPPKTLEVCSFPFDDGGYHRHPVIMVDTPGFDNDDVTITDAKVEAQIVGFLAALKVERLGILYLHPAGSKALDWEQPDRLYRLLDRLAGSNTLYAAAVLTTKWDKGHVPRASVMAHAPELWPRLQVIHNEGFQLDSDHSTLKKASDTLEHFLTELYNAREGMKLTSPPSGKSQPHIPSDIHTSTDDIVILMLGATGCGKSSFINHLWDPNFDCTQPGRVKVGHSFSQCTSDIQAVMLEQSKPSSKLKGRRVIILDTPGFDDTDVGDMGILSRISRWLEATYKKKTILSGVIYLHDLSQDRFTGTAKRNLEMLQRLCGDDALKKKTVLVTTKWSSVSSSKSEREREERKEVELRDVHWKALIEKGCKMQRFKRSQNSAQGVLDMLFYTKTAETRQIGISQVALQTQNELVVEPRILPQTAAGREYTLDEGLKRQASEPVALESQDNENMDEQTNKRLEDMEAQTVNPMTQVNLFPEISKTMAPYTGEMDIVILILGMTGAGKSTFINHLCDPKYDGLGRGRVEVGSGLTSCTLQAEEVQMGYPRESWPLRGNRVILVDTPGFDHDNIDDSQVLANWLENAIQRRFMLGGVIYLHDIKQGRFLEAAPLRNLQLIKEIFGNWALRKTIIVTTKWADDKQKLEQQRRNEDNLKQGCWRDLIQNGCTVRRFEGTRESALQILDVFLNKKSLDYNAALQVQEELVNVKILKTKEGKLLVWRKDKNPGTLEGWVMRQLIIRGLVNV